MRFPPGTIQISEQADLPLLRIVYRAGHLTARQLYDYTLMNFDKHTWKQFTWRVRRLASHGYLDRRQVQGMPTEVLSIGESGAAFLQGRERFLVEIASRSGSNHKRDQVWHDTELFEIYLALRRAGVVLLWQHEPEVRADNDFTSFGYAKDYDAVITFECSGRKGKVGLEYERTAKSWRQYGRIVELLNRDPQLHSFLYLVPNIHLQNYLIHSLQRATPQVCVGMANEFCTDPEQARLTDVRSQRVCQLSDCLPEPTSSTAV